MGPAHCGTGFFWTSGHGPGSVYGLKIKNFRIKIKEDISKVFLLIVVGLGLAHFYVGGRTHKCVLATGCTNVFYAVTQVGP